VRRAGMASAAVMFLMSVSPQLGAAAPAADPRGEFGVSLAISGEEARAESIFVTMLSHTRGDARALNNLGNLRLLRGETGVALAFYERALRGDSLDAGIHLNRATALMMIGDKDRSAVAFARGVKLAGGVDQAEALLGLPPETQQPTERAARKTAIDSDQLRTMLRQAATAVPKDTGRPSDSRTARTASPNRTAWRSAGARASDGGDSPQLLYWKR